MITFTPKIKISHFITGVVRKHVHLISKPHMVAYFRGLFKDEVELASIMFLLYSRLPAGFGCCRTLVKLFTDYRC